MHEAFSTQRPQIQNWRQRDSSFYGSYINNRTRPSSNVASSAKVKTMQSATRAIIYPQSSPITCNNDAVIEEFTRECEIQHNVVHLRRSSRTEPLIWRCWNFSDQVTSSKSSANSISGRANWTMCGYPCRSAGTVRPEEELLGVLDCCTWQ